MKANLLLRQKTDTLKKTEEREKIIETQLGDLYKKNVDELLDYITNNKYLNTEEERRYRISYNFYDEVINKTYYKKYIDPKEKDKKREVIIDNLSTQNNAPFLFVIGKILNIKDEEVKDFWNHLDLETFNKIEEKIKFDDINTEVIKKIDGIYDSNDVKEIFDKIRELLGYKYGNIEIIDDSEWMSNRISETFGDNLEITDITEGIEADLAEITEEIRIIQNTFNVYGELRREEYSDFEDVLESVDKYANDVNHYSQNTTKFEKMINTVLTIISNIGIVVAVLMSAILGIKYMLGSVEEKAEYKKDMIPYFVGVCLLFGISAILKVVQGFGNTINNI